MEVAVAPELLDGVLARWPPVGLDCRVEPAEPVEARFGLSDSWLIVPDREPSGTDPSAAAWNMLQSELTLFAVRRLSRLVAVHAAAIVHRGRVMMVPASSGGGKSTLSLAAHRAGLAVLSDEYTLVDPDTGLVTGWTRPVRERRRDGSIALADIAVVSEPLPVGLVALVRHDPEGDRWVPISGGEATGEILAHTVCARTRPDDALDAVLHITRSAPAVRGARGEAADAIADLLAHMDRAAPTW